MALGTVAKQAAGVDQRSGNQTQRALLGFL